MNVFDVAETFFEKRKNGFSGEEKFENYFNVK